MPLYPMMYYRRSINDCANTPKTPSPQSQSQTHIDNRGQNQDQNHADPFYSHVGVQNQSTHQISCSRTGSLLPTFQLFVNFTPYETVYELLKKHLYYVSVAPAWRLLIGGPTGNKQSLAALCIFYLNFSEMVSLRGPSFRKTRCASV